MRQLYLSLKQCMLFFILCGSVLYGTHARAQSENTLYDFSGGTDGGSPETGLIFDKQGNLYGTASGGGLVGGCEFGLGCGTVFELSPASGGGWTFATIYTFQGGGDGDNPGGPLRMDGNGNLFGETSQGGLAGGNCPSSGCGTVFELSPHGSSWSKQTLYQFQGGEDGLLPDGGLSLDSVGNLYGTTVQGGGSCTQTEAGCGTAFELIPEAGSAWKEVIFHRFGADSDGYAPAAGLRFDTKGNLFGTAGLGGQIITGCPLGCGVVFKLTLSGGKWTEQILHTFIQTDGSNPQATPVLDSSGNVYITTYQGGSFLGGTVVELSPQPGAWRSQVLHQFAYSEGASPRVGLGLSASGALYGVTEYGGDNAKQCHSDTNSGCGVVYGMRKTVAGKWAYAVLYRFTGNEDGNYPVGVPVMDKKGNLYGTTLYIGQTIGTGSVFEIAP